MNQPVLPGRFPFLEFLAEATGFRFGHTTAFSVCLFVIWEMDRECVLLSKECLVWAHGGVFYDLNSPSSPARFGEKAEVLAP